MNLKRSISCALLGAVLLASRSVGQTDPTTLIHPGTLPERSQADPTATSQPLQQQQTVIDGQICTTIDFEGVGNLAAIPEFDGISSPGWLGIIDADAGGTGNTANEPSPETVAFWLGGAPGARDIVLSEPASRVEFRYTSFVNVSMEAFDQAGTRVNAALGGPNFNQGSGDPNGAFNRWDPLFVRTDENVITRVRVSGNVNQTAIDNLTVCRQVEVHSIEVTQAIQELQEIDAMVADLQADREPPVPIIERKPAVLRVYFDEVQSAVTVRVEATIDGNAQTRQLRLQPGCTPDERRRRDGACASADFYFLPPGGDWDVTVRVLTDSGEEVDSFDLPLSSRDADTLALRAVTVCDARVQIIPAQPPVWQCAPAANLGGMVDFLRRTAPTHEVSVTVTNHFVRNETGPYDADGDGSFDDNEAFNWWQETVAEVGDLHGFFDSVAGAFGQERYYYGMVRNTAPGGIGGIADGIPGRGAMSRLSTVRHGNEVNHETVAHEVGHMLGRTHTNTDVPLTGAAPGCYNRARDNNTDWPFADNRIQSAANGIEVGFDVAGRAPIPGDDRYDWMGYCTPRWISGHTYTNAMSGVDADFATFESVAEGDYWTVSGVLHADLGLIFGPVYVFETEGSTEEGLGDYRIEVRDATGQALFARRFVPTVPSTETTHGDGEGNPVFFELIPVQAGATSVTVVDPSGTELGSLALAGSAPQVTVTFPTAGASLSGIRELTWTITDADSTLHWSAVDYSMDGGDTWFRLGEIRNEPSLVVDFDQVPGAANALIRVTVSDGANSGNSLSPSFSVTSKLPSVEILGPEEGEVFQLGDLAWLRAHAYDTDDGILDGEAVRWTSSLDGDLGTGLSRPVFTLSEGRHTLTVEVTDRGGNTATDSVRVVVASAPPALQLTVRKLDELPTTCVQVTIDAQPGSGLAGLTAVEYSLDGGGTWTAVPLTRLPFKFMVPGSGFFHLVARAVDEAGQVDVQDERFFIDSPCQMTNLPPVADAGPDRIVACSGTGSTPVTLDGSASFDPESQPLTYSWTGPFGNATGVSPTVLLPLGASAVNLVVNDGDLDSETDTAVITVALEVQGLMPPMAALVPGGEVPPVPARDFRMGSTIPLKLRLSCGDDLLAGDEVAAPVIASLAMNGTPPVSLDALDLDAGNSNGGGLAFRSTEGQWIYNLDTSALAPGDWVITLELPDGRSVSARFVLR